MKKTILLLLAMGTAVLAAPDQPPTEKPTPSVKLAWDQYDPPDPSIIGYRVWISPTAGGPYVVAHDVPANTLTKYDGGTGPAYKRSEPYEVGVGTWYCVVTAYNASGDSPVSNEISFTREDVPDAPSGLRIEITVLESSNNKDWKPIAKTDRPMEDEMFYRLGLSLKPDEGK